jgi:hypothetical protein
MFEDGRLHPQALDLFKTISPSPSSDSPHLSLEDATPNTLNNPSSKVA